MNKVVLSGRLSKDVELRNFKDGGAVASFSIALNRRVKQSDGTYKDEASFVEVKLFGRTAEVANQFLAKGSRLLVEGRLQQEVWADSNGQKRSRIVVVGEGIEFLDTKESGSTSQNSTQQDSERELVENYKPAPRAPKPQAEAPQKRTGIPEYNDEEEIPF